MNPKTLTDALSELQKSNESIAKELARINKKIIKLTNKTIDLSNRLSIEKGEYDKISPLIDVPTLLTKHFSYNLPNRIDRELYAKHGHRITNKELSFLYSDFNLHITTLTKALRAQGFIAQNSEVIKTGNHSSRAYKILDKP